MPTVTPDLTLLESRRLVLVTREREKKVVRFKHALTREATYNSILQARRAELHRAAAQTLTALNPQPDSEMVLTIAEHWRRAGDHANALTAVLPHAQTLLATGRSISLTALLTPLDRDALTATQQRDLDIVLGDAHAARGEYAPAQALYERALETADTPSLRTQLLQRNGTASYHLGEFERAIECYSGALDLAVANNEIVHQARARSGLGLTFWSLGDSKLALSYLESSRLLTLQLGEPPELANVEFNLAGVLMERGEYPAAIQAAGRALVLDEKLANPAHAARTLQLLGACHYSLGHYGESRTYYERALDASRAASDSLGVGLAHANLGELELSQGDTARAVREYEQGIRELRRLKVEYYLSGALAGLADAELRQAQSKNAAAEPPDYETPYIHIQESLGITLRIQSPEREGVARRVLAEILLQRGETAEAVEQAERAIQLLKQVGAALELERAQQTYDRILLQSQSPHRD